MMAKSGMVLAPLFIMLMVTLVNVGSFSGDEASLDLFDTRSVTENQENYFADYVNSAYDNYGENPNLSGDGGDWTTSERDDFTSDLFAMLNAAFGEHVGHIHIMMFMWDTMVDVYDIAPGRIENADIHAIVAIDPDSVIEWAELNARGISISDTVVFVGIFFGVAVLIGVAGIRILGSGLSDVSIMTILKVSLFLLVFALLSSTSYGYLDDIPIAGPWFWIVLTFIYAIGCFFNLTEQD